MHYGEIFVGDHGMACQRGSNAGWMAKQHQLGSKILSSISETIIAEIHHLINIIVQQTGRVLHCLASSQPRGWNHLELACLQVLTQLHTTLYYQLPYYLLYL